VVEGFLVLQSAMIRTDFPGLPHLSSLHIFLHSGLLSRL
jgi:hypothetical protein